MQKKKQKSTEFDLKTVKETTAKLYESVVELKMRSMRDNLIFTEILEQILEDTDQVLQNFLQNKYKLDYRIDCERVHRIGKWNEFCVHP